MTSGDVSYSVLALGQWPAALEERWAALRGLLRRWHGITLGPGDEITPRLRQLDVESLMPPPESIRQWVRLAEQLRRQGAWNRVLRDVFGGLRPIDAGGITEGEALLTAGEGDAHWLVSYEHDRFPDPPVQRYVRGEGGRWVHHGEAAPTVSEWCLLMVLENLRLAGCRGYRTVDVRPFDEIAADFPVRTDLTRAMVLEDRDALVYLRGDTTLDVHARSEEALVSVRSRLFGRPRVSW